MSSSPRAPLATAALLGGLLALGGCSIRKSPPPSSQFDINASQLGCVDKAGNQLESFFEGKASPQDVDAVWTCAENALDQFTQKVVGAEPGSYSAQELSDFLARYFIHEVPLTPGLVAQVGVLKQVLVGGAPDRLSVAEIQKLKSFFEVLRAQSQALRPYMPISPQGDSGATAWGGIGGLRWQDMDLGYIERFESTLQSAAGAIGDFLDSQGTSYSFNQLDRLAQSFLAALPANGDFDGTIQALSAVHSNLALIRAAKNTLVVPGTDFLSSGKDWSELLSTVTNWGELLVRATWLTDPGRLAVSQEHLDQGAGLVSLVKLFDRAQGLLVEAVKRHPGQQITFEELDQLVNSIPGDRLPISAQVIEVSFRPVVRRLIGGAQGGPDGRGASALTPGNLAKLYDIFHNWYEGERFLETLYAKVEEQEGDQEGADFLFRTLTTSPAAATLWSQVFGQTGGMWNAYTKSAAQRIWKLLVAPDGKTAELRPLFMGVDNEITFPKYDEGLRYSFHDLATLNWMQSLSRLLIEGYAAGDLGPDGTPLRADTDDWQPGTGPGTATGSMVGAGVTLAEFQQAFNDFKPLGVALKFFNPDSPNAPFDRFREGDVFTYVSDGNGYLDMNEAATLLAFAVSAKRKSDRIHGDIASRCHTLELDSIYEKPLINYACYAGWFYGQVQEYWDKLDELVNYYQGLPAPMKTEFQKLLETSARQDGYNIADPISIDDTENMVAALQYVEAIFTRYDVDDQGYLDPGEAANAFPVFKGILEQMGTMMNPPVHLDDSSANLVFTYMLAKGKAPQGTWPVILWDIQKHLPLLGDFKADRIRILQIFAALSEETTSSSPAPAVAASAR